MIPSALPSRRQAIATCVLAVLTVVACAGLLMAATLANAPAAVMPLVVMACIGVPLAMAWSVPVSLAVLRASAPQDGDHEAIATLRDSLAKLPETAHPLGL